MKHNSTDRRFSALQLWTPRSCRHFIKNNATTKNPDGSEIFFFSIDPSPFAGPRASINRSMDHLEVYGSYIINQWYRSTYLCAYGCICKDVCAYVRNCVCVSTKICYMCFVPILMDDLADTKSM